MVSMPPVRTGVHRRSAEPRCARVPLALAALACLLFLGALPPPAAAADDLETLIEERRYEAAYERAREQRAERAGEPLFDFYYGLAAVEQGELSEGIFALERALITRPGFDRARLELARAYFLQGDDRRARREFETVQAHDPPASVDAQIEQYLAAIQRRSDKYETQVSGYVEAGAGYDTNVNAATSSEAVDTVVGRIGLPSASREREDGFGELDGRVRISHPVSPDVNLIGEAGARGRFFGDEDQFNTATTDGRFGFRVRRPGWQVRATLDLLRFYLDGEDYRDQIGASGVYQVVLADRSAADVSLEIADFSYDTRESLDSTLWILGAGLTHTLDARRRPTFSARAYLGGESADGDSISASANAEREIYGVQGGLRMALAPQWQLRGSAEARVSEYDEPDLLFSEARDEDYYRLELGVDWRPTTNWRFGPHLRYTANESNIDLYDYERTEFQIRARYDFY